MGLKHEAKQGTTIEVNGVKVTVLRGSPQLDITAPRELVIRIGRDNSLTKSLERPNNTRKLKHRS